MRNLTKSVTEIRRRDHAESEARLCGDFHAAALRDAAMYRRARRWKKAARSAATADYFAARRDWLIVLATTAATLIFFATFAAASIANFPALIRALGGPL
jgi:hypothetical protein